MRTSHCLKNESRLWDPDIGPMETCSLWGESGIRAERGDNRMSLFTKDEQYTLMSLFPICRSPLMFGGNLPDNDEFTLNLITNEEVLAVLHKSKNNRLLFDDGEKIGWIADNRSTSAKYVGLFYASDQKPIEENKALWNSRLITSRDGGQGAKAKVDIAGAKKLFLVVTDGGDGYNWDHADWIEPTLTGRKGSVNLTDIPWTNATSGWGNATIGKSVGGNTLIVGNTEYAEGIGTHSNSVIEYNIPEGYDTFTSIVGLDKECLITPKVQV